MLIVGAKGLAKEVLEIFNQQNNLQDLTFFDDVSFDISDKLYEQFSVLKSIKEIEFQFKLDNKYIIAIGNPILRYELYKKIESIGGNLVSAISPYATIGHFGTHINAGSIIMSNTVITNDVTIGNCTLINPNCTISHDVRIGNFTDIGPGVQIPGWCLVGDFCNIGTGAILLPKVKIGNNVSIGAGAVVTKDVMDGETVVGVPARPLIKNKIN